MCRWFVTVVLVTLAACASAPPAPQKTNYAPDNRFLHPIMGGMDFGSYEGQYVVWAVRAEYQYEARICPTCCPAGQWDNTVLVIVPRKFATMEEVKRQPPNVIAIDRWCSEGPVMRVVKQTQLTGKIIYFAEIMGGRMRLNLRPPESAP